jgi:hypothetical protein
MVAASSGINSFGGNGYAGDRGLMSGGGGFGKRKAKLIKTINFNESGIPDYG